MRKSVFIALVSVIYSLLIFDRSTGMMRYTMDGKFIDKTIIKGMPQEFALLPGGDWLFYSPYVIDDLEGLWVTDSKGDFCSTISRTTPSSRHIT